ncbi:carboxypeptidase-like regulatory domain-containing protein [Sphingomonas sp. SUN039]|uniref:carboxypeptidase-like regulatory domain-containing protein n=1 Tax=Sphingomonas sp. SUN039 TaxID=2937787 RepID=UPI0021649855|nr:carboxypeptidase-like regulatory domain-containing protein [Sphingomonas sp. SUN039]UVO55172.1 carboxypeptidase-like regulatory domain-containing protein [Sphingomonas sp. SUN039]
MIRRMRAGLAAIAAMASLAHAAPVQAAAWSPNADDALLFDVRTGPYRVGDGVRGYATPTGTCVDLADVLIALDIPIRLDKKSRRATGWAFDERHIVTIDRASGIEQIMNNKREVAPDDIRDTPEGWCVSTVALSRWFGATFAADTNNALLVVKADRKLPPEAAAERRARAATARPDASFDLGQLPQSRISFKGAKPPAVDVVASIGGLRDRLSGNRLDAQYELYAAGEVGPVAYNARLSSDRSGLPSTLRLQAYRTDPKGGLLGPLKATTVAAGDVQGFSTPLVAVSSAGRGAMITNRPVERSDRFDKIDLRGELPRGWDAELYRNGQLIAFAQDRADGRYEFLDAALQYGQNRFEVVLYGPQGQIRREVKSVPVGFDSIPPRKTFYWAGINEDGRDLIDLGRSPSFGRGGWRGTFGLERGLDARTSVAAFAHSLVVDGLGRQNYVEASLRRALGSALLEVSGSATSGGYAFRAQAIGEIRKTRYTIETIWANGFRSDRLQAGVTGLHSITFDQLFGNGRSTIPVSITARLTTRSTGTDTLDVTSRVSANVGRVSLTGELRWRDDLVKFGPDPPGVMEAGLLANARIGRVRLRGEARFRLAPETRFDSATLVGEWAAGKARDAYDDSNASWRAEIGYDRGLGRGRVGMGYVRRFDRLALTASAEAATDGSVAAGLNIAFSLGPDPRAGRSIRMTSEKLASRGTALVRVYRDLNANGRHDFSEPWEKDVAVTAGRVPVDKPTDARGEALVDGLEPFQPVLIGIDSGSLPDPMVQPSLPGMVVTPRPGVVAVVELPLVGAGDIDGTLVRAGGGSIEGVDLELLDIERRVVAKTRTDFDGFFLFERVAYGRYTVRIAQLAADAVKLSPVLAGVADVGANAPSAHLGAVAAEPATVRAAGK